MKSASLFAAVVLSLLTHLYAHPLEPFIRLGNMPFTMMNGFFGTTQSPFGGASFPMDSRLFAMVARPPYLMPGHKAPPIDPYCHEFFQRKEGWMARAAAKIAGEGSSDDAWISLIDTPEEMAEWEPEDYACLFYLGYAPPRIPEGLAFGRVYSVLGNPVINDVAEIFWGGKIFMKVPCEPNGDAVYLSVNQASRMPAAWGRLYISNNPQKESMGIFHEDWIDNDEYLWVDYGADLENVCPKLVPRFYDSAPGYSTRDRLGILSRSTWAQDAWARINADGLGVPSLVGQPGAIFAPGQASFGMFDNAWPLRDVIDQLRWVGRDEEHHTDIYLGRALYGFPEGLRVVSWFNLKLVDLVDKPILHVSR